MAKYIFYDVARFSLSNIFKSNCYVSFCFSVPKWKTFFLLPLLAMGKQGRIRGFDVKDGSEIVMELDQPVVLHADGEYCGDVQHICFHCMKNTLWLLHGCTEK